MRICEGTMGRAHALLFKGSGAQWLKCASCLHFDYDNSRNMYPRSKCDLRGEMVKVEEEDYPEPLYFHTNHFKCDGCQIDLLENPYFRGSGFSTVLALLLVTVIRRLSDDSRPVQVFLLVLSRPFISSSVRNENPSWSHLTRNLNIS